jgi:dTDP-4-dehydrorhamnose reductase
LARGSCLLIGARGFLGRQINRSLRDSDIDAVGTTRRLADGDPSSWIQYEFPNDPIGDRIRGLRFDFVIVAAKLAHANIEANPSRGTQALAFDELFGELSRSTRSGVTYLSSDAVFSGARGRYLETDEPDASEAYGSMQAAAERSLSAYLPNHLIVRPSFLFDVDDFRRDRRLSQMYQALTSRKPFFGDTNVYKSPVRVADAARVVVERTLAGQSGIVHVPGKRQSIYEFFECGLEPLGITEFRQYLVARKNDRPSDTSLCSLFEHVSA